MAATAAHAIQGSWRGTLPVLRTIIPIPLFVCTSLRRAIMAAAHISQFPRDATSQARGLTL
jgi:hypothetical protein